MATYEFLPKSSEVVKTSFVVHGYFDHTAWMRPLIDKLLELNHRVIAFDLPGHGLSSGRRGEIDSFSSYATAFKTIYDYYSNPRHENSYYGFSTGATPFVHWSLMGEEKLGILPDFKQVHLVAPLVRVALYEFSWIPLVYERVFKKYEFPRKKSYKAMNDPLAINYVHTKWLYQNRIWNRKVYQLKNKRKDIKIKVWTGDSDKTVSWRYNLKLLKRLYSCDSITFPGIGHRLVDVPHVLDNIIEKLD